MPIFEKFPYSNIHEMNLDWVINTMKELLKEWDTFGTSVTASAHESNNPEVTVTGSAKTTINFDFGLVRGLRGEKGETGDVGPVGPAGEDGKPLIILDMYDTLAELQAAHPTGEVGDTYLVGEVPDTSLYGWSEILSAWREIGPLSSPAPSDATPLEDGEADAGDSLAYSRGDHKHPSDTTKLDKVTNDGTKVELYAVAGNVQNVVKLTDSVEAGKAVMYDQVTGNVHTGVPVEYDEAMRVADRATMIAQASNLDPLIELDSNASGDPIIKANFDSFDVNGTVQPNLNVQVTFDKNDFKIHNNKLAIKEDTSLLQLVYPVGSLYFTTVNIDPAVVLGFGTWSLRANKLPIGENVYGNGKNLAFTNGSNVGGIYINAQHILTVDGQARAGENVGTTYHVGGPTITSESAGVPTKAQLGGSPQNSGLIMDSITVSIWQRTA